MKKKNNIFLIAIIFLGLCGLTNLQAQDWTQIGANINGEAAGDNSGNSVSISSDGSIVAIGAYQNDGTSTYGGQVRIYQNNSGIWSQIGADIDGLGGDHSGCSVNLSSDGSVVAIGSYGNGDNGAYSGCVRIYQNNSGTWSQIGTNIDGEAAYDMSGNSVSLSSDGSIVAIGATGNDGNGSNSGQVRIYQNNSGTWSQIGADIDGEASGDQFGCSVSLSSDGSIVAIGALYNDGNGSDAGHVRIYKNISGTWIQIGSDIDGEAASDHFGKSVSLSSDGSIVAIGAPNSNYVCIYQNNSGTWTQIGADIIGGYNAGFSVSLSSDASTVAIGAYKSGASNNQEGQVRIYQNNSGTWTQIGANINGEADGDWFGYSVSLNSDNSTVAIGAVYNDDNGSDAGHVKVYKFLLLPTITSQPANQSNICPGSNASFTISGTNIDSYQWQVDEGSGFVNVSNGSVYSGATTSTLNITGLTLAMNNYHYRCIVTNGDGNTTSDTAILTTDNEAPASPTLSDITDECSATVTAPTTTDNCVGTITGTTTDPLTYTTQGTHVITWTFDDGNGNSININQNVIIDDITAPATPTLSDITDECSVTVTAPTTTDNCAGTITGTTTDPLTYTTQGTHVITWTFDDGNGNSINVNQNVIIDDITEPTITCVGNQTINLNGGETTYTVSGSEFDPTNSDDNCGVASVINNFNSLATLGGTEIPIGTTTIVWTVTDIAGNETTCSFDITVSEFVGIEGIDGLYILIYPNPAKQFVNISIPNSITINEILIFDITGQEVFENKTTSNNTLIDISGFQTGTYFVRIISKENTITKKLIIK